MQDRRPLGKRFALALIACLTACSDQPDLGPEDVCADPADCRLFEAGQIAGVNVGLASPLLTESEIEVTLAESNILNNHMFSWAAFEPNRDDYRFEELERRGAIAEENGIPQNAFHFAWENQFLDDFPAWVGDITDPEELREELRQRAAVIFERYPNLAKINVINEPLSTFIMGEEALEPTGGLEPNHFYQVLGPDYIEELFWIVDAAAPDGVELVLNDNFTEYFPLKAQALVALVRQLVDSGAPIDSVGFQTHLMLTELFDIEPDFELHQETMQQVADLGVNVWISELDNPVDPTREDWLEFQAANYRRAVEACLAVSRCTDIQIWGVQDGDYFFDVGYEPTSALLFTENFERKPAYFAVRDALLRGRP
ncbi:MAG: endo-1,4-beta-xylanase [Myxococcota bacterium]